ncbi:MAG TPA: protein kinase, partial [Candidatus Eisenbacteria bacterium]|nr:protein kinase [Candidatus Eisenbacteria bacterium]
MDERRISRYRLKELLGEGGMGTVYRARDERLERDVAVKILRSAVREDEGARKRFRREASALSRLSHP